MTIYGHLLFRFTVLYTLVSVRRPALLIVVALLYFCVYYIYTLGTGKRPLAEVAILHYRWNFGKI